MSLLQLRIVAIVAVAGISLSACQGDQPRSPSSAPSAEVAGTKQQSVKGFARLFGGFAADYTPFDSIQEMEAASQLALGGTITDIRPGRILYAESLDSPEAAQALVMEVA